MSTGDSPRTFATQGSPRSAPVPVAASVVGSPPDFFVRVVFDQPLEVVPNPNLVGANWKSRIVNFNHRGVDGFTTDASAFVRLQRLNPNPGPNVVAYTAVVPDVRSLDTGLPAAPFEDFPVSV